MTRIAQLEPTLVTVGVDTHRDVHVAVALDQLGRRLGEIELATTRAGYQRLLAWAERFGAVEAFGIEGTGCYGAGLARHLRARKVFVIPASYVTTRFGIDYVRIRQADRTIETPVQRGRDLPSPELPNGLEILSGVRVGDQLVQP